MDQRSKQIFSIIFGNVGTFKFVPIVKQLERCIGSVEGILGLFQSIADKKSISGVATNAMRSQEAEDRNQENNQVGTLEGFPLSQIAHHRPTVQLGLNRAACFDGRFMDVPVNMHMRLNVPLRRCCGPSQARSPHSRLVPVAFLSSCSLLPHRRAKAGSHAGLVDSVCRQSTELPGKSFRRYLEYFVDATHVSGARAGRGSGHRMVCVSRETVAERDEGGSTSSRDRSRFMSHPARQSGSSGVAGDGGCGRFAPETSGTSLKGAPCRPALTTRFSVRRCAVCVLPRTQRTVRTKSPPILRRGTTLAKAA